jgi:hypothetical protein
MSYFSKDPEINSLLMRTILDNGEFPIDHEEETLADSALGIIDEIDRITKRHFPYSLWTDESPFPRSEILDVQQLGLHRLMVTITARFMGVLKHRAAQKESVHNDVTNPTNPIQVS